MNQEVREKIEQVFLNILPAQEQQEIRVRGYYFSVLEWIVEQAEKQRGGENSRAPLIIGVNGPQGSGKSTLTAALVRVLPVVGLRAVTLSIDDFYWTRQEQIELAARHPRNSLLQQRGYPGTHDIELGVQKLVELRKATATGGGSGSDPSQSSSVRIPYYDKSKHKGQGDRLPKSEWTEIHGPLDLLFLEGWMLGFTPLAASDPRLNADTLEINQLLGQYQRWHKQLDAFIHLIPHDIHYVVDWRVEAEERMKAQGKPGMSRLEITDYIQKFISAYELYLPQLIAHPLVPERTLQLELSQERMVRGPLVFK
jgi:D-glycerate 3-kinase